MVKAASFLFVLVVPTLMNAGVVYEFSVPTPGNGVDPIAFSITSPSYITSSYGHSAFTPFSEYGVTFTPFSITRGSDIWFIMEGFFDRGSLYFYTNRDPAPIDMDPYQAIFYVCGFSYPCGLPETDGTFLLYGSYSLNWPYNTIYSAYTDDVTLKITSQITGPTDAPEPATVGLFMIGLGVWAGIRRRRL